MAGRAGRTADGRVILQTFRPDDPVITAAAGHDYAAFAADELPLRRELGYPPYGRLLRLGLSGRRQGETEAAAAALAAAVRGALSRDGIAVLGPAPGVFARINDRYRYQILIKGRLERREKEWLARCLEEFRGGFRRVDVMHDVDPESMY